MYFYCHIPFCRKRCTYCTFALVPVVEEVRIAKYVAHLGEEIANGVRDQSVQSIYFGGGTPSVLSIEHIGYLLEQFPLEARNPDCEITLEANPEDITREYAEGLAKLRVNRISLGVQSLSTTSLKEVNRSHPDTVFRALRAIEGAGIASVNVDFILGLPRTQAGETLSAIQKLQTDFPFITHTSVYFLEKGGYPKHWKEISLSEVDATREYSEIVEYLVAERGFVHYEVSNFAKPGYESRHNRAYWTGQDVRGFGLSATSYVDGQRSTNASSFLGYYSGKIVESEILTPEQKSLETAMCQLRTFSLDPTHVRDAQVLEAQIATGKLEMKNGKIRPTLSGIFILDHIMSGLF